MIYKLNADNYVNHLGWKLQNFLNKIRNIFDVFAKLLLGKEQKFVILLAVIANL